MFLTNLDQVARRTGLPVVELPGWQTRGRPASAGPFNPEGVLCHHTGGSADTRAYVEWMTYTGRPEDGIPPPLVQLALSRTGIVYVCAAGRANHAGKTKPVGGWLTAGDGNAQLVGIEAMNTGSEGWTPPQYQAYVRLCAALCAAYQWPAGHVLGHKETSLTGKWDPGRMDMNTFRAFVAQTIQSEETMSLTPADVQLILNTPTGAKDKAGQEVTVRRALAGAWFVAEESSEGGAFDEQWDRIEANTKPAG